MSAEKKYTSEHERIKQELIGKFTTNTNYSGSHVRDVILKSDFKGLKGTCQKPSKIKKGDVFTSFEGKKSRPCVVAKVLKNRTVLYIPLTSTENVHCMTPYKSRFWGEGCFSSAFSVCTEELAIENFIGVFESTKDLNKAIKDIKEFINNNL